MPDVIHSLPDHLAAEAELMESFVALLQKEQEAIKGGDTQVMEYITAEKMTLVAALNRQSDNRNQFLSTCGLQHDRTGIEAWLAENPKAAHIADLWGQLKKLVAEAKELNLLNGKLISMRMQHNQQLLNALVTTSRSHNSLYGPDGQPTQLSGRRIIDAA